MRVHVVPLRRERVDPLGWGAASAVLHRETQTCHLPHARERSTSTTAHTPRARRAPHTHLRRAHAAHSRTRSLLGSQTKEACGKRTTRRGATQRTAEHSARTRHTPPCTHQHSVLCTVVPFSFSSDPFLCVCVYRDQARGLDQPGVPVAYVEDVLARVLVQRLQRYWTWVFSITSKAGIVPFASAGSLASSSVPSSPLSLLSTLPGLASSSSDSPVACVSGKITEKRVRPRKGEESKALKESGVEGEVGFFREQRSSGSRSCGGCIRHRNSLAERAGSPCLRVCKKKCGS